MEHLLRRLPSTDVKHHAVSVGLCIVCTVVPFGRPCSHVMPPPSTAILSVQVVWPRHCEQEATLLAGHDPAARAPRALSLPSKRRDSLCTPKQRKIRQTHVTSDVATRDVQLRVPCSQLLVGLSQLLLLQLLLLLGNMLLGRHCVLLCSLPVANGLLQLDLCLEPQLELLCPVPPELLLGLRGHAYWPLNTAVPERNVQIMPVNAQNPYRTGPTLINSIPASIRRGG